jgi:predicted short-subunit dehydrogenase-like oxidoreductase (DUF2520 family)
VQTFASFALVGPGRAGTAISEALLRAGLSCVAVAGRAPDAPSTVAVARRLGAAATTHAAAARDADLVVVGTPDAAVAATAEALAPSLRPGAVVVHLAGALGLDPFDALVAARPDVRIAAVHPLQTFPGNPDDADRLAGAWFALEGDPAANDLVTALGGRPFAVTDRTLYHAAAVVASNHAVALLGQVARLAAAAGAPLEAFAPLVAAATANAVEHGAAAALTGPVARGDAVTVALHLDALPHDERAAYRALAREALRLTGRVDPAVEAVLAEPGREPLVVKP